LALPPWRPPAAHLELHAGDRLEKSQAALVNAQQQNDKLAESLNETNAKLRVTSETLGQSVGLTQRQLEARASEFLKRQQAETSRLEKEQQAAQAEAQKQIGAVSSDVSSVKTDVGGVKTDVAATKTELANAESQVAEGDRRSGRDQRAGRDQRQRARNPQAQGRS
jgi:SMC interacting uncharacterized protein involved in chromosome segregation